MKTFIFSPKHLIFKREFPWVDELLRHDSAAQSLLQQKKKRQTKRGRQRDNKKKLGLIRYGMCRKRTQNNAVVIYCYVMTTNKAVSSALIIQHQMNREDDN
jgi:hypothetical protein